MIMSITLAEYVAHLGLETIICFLNPVISSTNIPPIYRLIVFDPYGVTSWHSINIRFLSDFWILREIEINTSLMWATFKVFIELLKYCFCLMFCFFDCEAWGILAPGLGVEPVSAALEGKVLTTGPSGESQVNTFMKWVVIIWLL